MSKKIVILIVIIIVMLLGVVIYIKDGVEQVSLNNMYKDVSLLKDDIDLYYLKNDKLPIKNELINFEYSSNPNDNEEFYEINLEKLDNLSLSYGYNKNQNDIYIVNVKSHTVYYYNGIKYKNEMYYTTKKDYTKIDLEKYQ